MANIDNTYNKRYPIELLPDYLQTDSLKKVFNTTVNHLFQPSSVEFLDGYIGNIPAWYNASRDFYIPEPTTDRENYQLTPTIVSNPLNNPELTNAIFYSDLVNQIGFQGGLINNPDRLFSQEYYSWSPPIDLDMFVNYTNYYWLPNGPDAITLCNTTDLTNDAVGQISFNYVGTVIYTSDNSIETFTEDNPLVFTSGMKIVPSDDANSTLNGEELLVENVGRSINLVTIADTSKSSWDISGWSLYGWSNSPLSTPLYITIARSSSDQNQWSVGNRWFHRDIILLSKTKIIDLSIQQAIRPILQFDSDIELFDYGSNYRGIVTLVDYTTTNFLEAIVGQSSWEIDGVYLQDGMRILSTAKQIVGETGLIYIVSGVSKGSIELTVDTANSINGDGLPVAGDRAAVLFGSFQGQNILYKNNTWTTNCQQQIGLNPPLFQLYDIDGNKLNDPVLYPNSSFTGSQVFSYANDPNQPIDPYIGQSLELDQFGDWVFNNNLITYTINYTQNSQKIQYTGYTFVKIGTGGSAEFINSWYSAPQVSRQYIINEFVLTTDTKTFTIDQTPAQQVLNTLPTIFVYLNVNQGETLLQNNIDYTVSGNIITLNVAASAGSIVTIASWNSVAPETLTGYYEVPVNLSANPNNLEITSVSRSQFLQQFQQIIENQSGFSGQSLGNNNYRDTAQQRGLGLSILQHRAPLLKLGILNSSPLSKIGQSYSPTDPVQAIQYAESSYTRFYNRLLRALFNLSSQQGFAANSQTVCDPYNTSLWLNTALTQINIGKTSSSPWANTGYGDYPGAYAEIPATVPLYIPATATRLGITKAYQPQVYFDYSYKTPKLTIQTHDGARIVMVDNQGEQLGTILHNLNATENPEQLTNPVAAAWLQFELNMFNNLPEPYRNSEAKSTFDITAFSPGKWRVSDYTRQEYIQLQRGPFDKWVVNNQVDYQSNTGYDALDPFSFNYRSVTDRDGNSIPGHWQGIYRWFYDTDRPHLCPWEMLGFSQEPSWWTAQYGSAPYTSGNTALWQDLTDGIIRQGPLAGQYDIWARPGLLSCIPVDSQGNLLSPVQAGCASGIPTTWAAQEPWIFGDGGPIETAWINSQYFPFVKSYTGYLMKPAAFVEYTWDSLRTEEIYSDTTQSQWIYADTNTRRSSNQFYINRELPNTLVTGVTIPNETNLAYFASAGFQVWITEFLLSQNLAVTPYLGNIIRGADVKLSHRMSGFINSSNFRAVVDSFGQLGFNSQIIPSENITTYLYRSTPTGVYFYSGVIVQQVETGWTVFGYDAIEQYFTIIPSNTAGPRNNIVIGNKQVVEYQTGLPDVTQQILYNTVLETYQEVYDFIISYGRWLTSQGWIFENYDTNSGNVLNWSQSAKEFLLWAQGSWANGTLIALSPGATSTTLQQPLGLIQYVNGTISGTYPVVDRAGTQIQSQNLNILRDNNTLTLQPTNSQGIFGLRLFTTTIESAVFFDNFTAFGDIIYDPLYNIQQQRIKIYCYRANGWNGTLDAPGYLVVQNNVTVNGATVTSNTWTLTNNFDKTANDISKYFNIDEPKNYSKILFGGTNVSINSTTLGNVDDTDISNLAKHTVGYQPRQYLDNLLLDASVEFQFYQGFIRQKGSLSTIDSLLRSNSILPTGTTFNYYDEWMIRVGTYGATALNVEIEFILPQSEATNDPQWIRMYGATSNNPYSEVYDLVANDPYWVTEPTIPSSNIFALTPNYNTDFHYDLPTAGYAQLGEANFYVVYTPQLLSLWLTQSTTNNPMQPYNTVWQFITDNTEWQMWILVPAISQISYTIQSPSNGQPTTIVTESSHGLLNGDICVIFGVSGASNINDTYIINSVTATTFNIDLSTFSNGTGGSLWVYRPMRFTNIFQRDTGSPPGGYMPNMLTYVDDGGSIPGTWTVYKYTSSGFIPYRQQLPKPNPNLIQSSQFFNLKTGISIATLEYFDPVQSRFPKSAEQELTYITDSDPASYNSGDTSGYAFEPTLAWSDEHLGETWWDVSQVRYIDYNQGDALYKLKNWGKIAPGTEVIVYEWISSSIPPTQWDTTVRQNSVAIINGIAQVPNGIVKTPFNWVQQTTYNAQQTATTVYYFWVGNSSMPPAASTRSLVTQNIVDLIQNPSLSGNPWYAVIASNSIIVGNYRSLISNNQISQRINYTSMQNNANIYSEWELIREGDPTSPINPTVWNRLKSSLITFDGLGNDVPDYHLNVYNKFGTFTRPRQTWFEDRVAASSLFITTFNDLVSAATSPIVYNPEINGWLNYFDAEEPLPNQYMTITVEITGSVAQSFVGPEHLNVQSHVTTTNCIGLEIGQPIIFADSFGGINANTTYYVIKILSVTAFTISDYAMGTPLQLPTYTASTTATQTITIWDYKVQDLGQRDNLVGAIVPLQYVLVESNSVTNNRWAIWQYTPSSSEIWTLKQIQSYKTSNYWQYTDWYAAGYTSTSQPIISVDTISELQSVANPTSGLVCKVTNSGDGTWQWYAYLAGSWQLVAQQNGSIQVLPNIYDWATYLGGFDSKPFDGSGTQLVFNPTPGFDDNATVEFGNIIDGIYNSIYPGPESQELNTLFFAMINYVVSEQITVDWIFKTSNMVFTGFNQTLGQPPLLAVDNTQSLLSFINEAKPYHANIQDYINGYTITDLAQASVVDFDVPFANLTENTPVSAINPDSVNLDTAYSTTYQSWYNNYKNATGNLPQLYIDPSLVRNLNIQLVFDRISTPSLVLGWDSLGWSVFGWSNESDNLEYGALTRIDNYYEPTPGMIPKIISDLMQGVVYSGQTIGNLGFQAEPGWGAGPWGGLLGWDANADVVNAYIDQIIQGGQIPHYDSAIGNGSTIIFPLLKKAQNPNNMVVWSDGNLRLYGVDWIVPTFATNAYVVDGGSGYSVGDQLIVLAGNGIAATRIRVDSVNATSIVSVSILGKGSYTTVFPGPYSTQYAISNAGSGNNAKLGIDWDCSSIQFYSPPASSSKPNVFILYVGTTFEPATTDDASSIYDGYQFVSPYVDSEHPEELYTLRARDCIRIDTRSVQVGGRPVVIEKAYITDGFTEQYDLGVTPQSDQAVMAYLDSVPLIIGPQGDVVINYETNKLVFVNLPSSGKTLYITSIGFGGEGRSVSQVSIVSGGTGYHIGDTITLAAGMDFNPPIITVSKISTTGSIEAVSISNPGLYPRLPTQPISQSATSGTGTNAKFNVLFADSFNRYSFTGDGSNTVFPLPNSNPTNGIMINVAGQLVDYSGWQSVPVTSIVLSSPPPYGSTVTIATFETADFSTVKETVFTITNINQYVYNIPTSVSTVPVYISTTVRKNGQIVNPPSTEAWVGNGSIRILPISIDISSYLQLFVYIDDVLLTNGYQYQIIDNELVFVNPPNSGAAITLIVINADTEYTIVPDTPALNSIIFAPGYLLVGDTISVTTYSQDISYEFKTEIFDKNSSGIYPLAGYPNDLSTVQVWYDGNIQIPQKDYTFTTITSQNGWDSGGWDSYYFDTTIPTALAVNIPHASGGNNIKVVVSYMLGLEQVPEIAWRTTIGWDSVLSTALDSSRETVLVSNVYTYSSQILVDDVTKITSPITGEPGLVYINDELISFTNVQLAPTMSSPNQGYLTGIARNRLGTSGDPYMVYNTEWYNGDGTTKLFPIASASAEPNTSVFVNGLIQVQNSDFVFVTDPENLPAGVYVEFVIAPPSGVKNIQITNLVSLGFDTQLSHLAGSTIIDAGTNVQIPGGYQWVPTPNGLQYSQTELAKFLLMHSGV